MTYERLEPTAKQMLDEASEKDVQVMMMVDGFQTDDEALILRDMFWYARDKGVTVILAPNTKEGEQIRK